MSSWATSSINSGVVAPAGLQVIQVSGTDKIVKPTDENAHTKYTFFVRVGADGGSLQFFGSYTLHVGCTALSTSYSDNAGFVTSINLFVGASPTNIYTF